MTDITKRLAEALRKHHAHAMQYEVHYYPGSDDHEDTVQALADFDRTAAQEANVANMCGSAGGQFIVAAPHPAAQEANVQGGEWVMVPREPTQEMMDATQEAFTAINGILATAQARAGMVFSLSDNGYPPIRNAYVAMLAAAPNPTPAPASGAVTDAERGEIAYSIQCRNRHTDLPTVRFWVDAVLNEAATRARQGEVGIPIGWPKGGLGAPNAADAEAICPACAKPVSVHNLTTAREIEIWFSAWKHAWSDEARTAAPVPAEQDRVGRLQIYVEKELCSLLGRPWATSGFSIETLIADLRKRLAVPADEGEK